MKVYERLAQQNQLRAAQLVEELELITMWEQRGDRANIVGSLAMNLLVKHLDIDIHAYSEGLTEESSFAAIAPLAKNPGVKEIRCINGLHTDERCVAWHLTYEDTDSRLWQIDIIHIDSGSRYDGYFELMARKIAGVLTPEQRDTIMRLKFETPADETIHGVDYYRAVIEHNVSTLPELRRWIASRPDNEATYWMPE